MKKISIETTKGKARAALASSGATKAKRGTAVAKPKAAGLTATIGLDLGDRTSRYCELNAAGQVIREASVAMTRVAMTELFATRKPCRIALEVGTHSRWVSQVIASLGHEVIVANARQLKLISESTRKDDKMDARMLAKMARAGVDLLRPIRHRGEQAQMDLTLIRVRAVLVETRTKLVNATRGMVKGFGERLPSCDAMTMGVARGEGLPKQLQTAFKHLLEEVEALSARIKQCDAELDRVAFKDYPETKLLQQISGVGTLISLAFVLTIDDPHRFAKSRDVGCFLGLRPKRAQSGGSNPQLGISKEGDRYLRSLLVQGAQYILGWRGPDTDLRRWGLRLAGRGGKSAKKRAIVAVARKLAVLLHRLWVTGEVYEPLRNNRPKQAAA
jgi:transposase